MTLRAVYLPHFYSLRFFSLDFFLAREARLGFGREKDRKKEADSKTFLTVS
jgi:hypothetical protein